MRLTIYLHMLYGRIFKILPMREREEAGEHVFLDKYLSSLSIELQGACDTFVELQDSEDYIVILNTVNGLCAHTPLPFLKREVFKMLHIVKELQAEYGGDGLG